MPGPWNSQKSQKNPMGMDRRARGSKAFATGLQAEARARWLLQAKLYRVLGTRVKTPAGEVDLLAKRGRTLVLVEVKARTTLEEAAQALRPRQQERLARAGAYLLGRTEGVDNLRFDLVLLAPGRWPRHLPDAWRL